MSSEAGPWPRRAGDVTIEARSEPGGKFMYSFKWENG